MLNVVIEVIYLQSFLSFFILILHLHDELVLDNLHLCSSTFYQQYVILENNI